MRPLLLAGLAASLTLACDRHTIAPPRAPAASARLEVGPVLTEKGVDIGPAIADRIQERGLADAHFVAVPSGSAPYVDGSVRLSDVDRGRSPALMWSEVSFVVVGGLLDLAGALVVGTADGNSNTAGVGGGILGVGLALTGIGILLFTHPQRYMDATVHANLTVIRGDKTSPLQLTDTASVYHRGSEPQIGASKLLDGVVNGTCTETQP